MYGEVQGSSIVPPAVAGGAVVVLPATGADFITSAALAVAAGLVTWGVIYFYKVVLARS